MSRRRFIWQEAETQSGLPEGYTAVDYLQSSGSQWIDTGYRYGASSDIEIKFGTSADGALIGAQDSDDNKYKFAIVVSEPIIWMGRGKAVAADISDMQKPLVLRNVVSLFKITDSTGKEKREASNNPDYVGPQSTIYLFARHTPTGTTQMSKSLIYYCRFYENGKLVCDMRPCLDTDGVPCMYDLVRKQTLYNQGTGSFTWG